jgi:hypothetical protein
MTSRRSNDDSLHEAFTQLAQALAHTSQAIAHTFPAQPNHPEASFHELAADYIADTGRQRLVMVLLYIASLVLVGLAVGISIWAADVATRGGTFLVAEFLGRVSVVSVLLLTAAAMTWQADRHRRSAAEQLSLARQLRTLPVFIESVEDHSLKDLLRGAVAPRFFPRALDDDDVLGEPHWPNPDQVLSALGKELADEEPDGA